MDTKFQPKFDFKFSVNSTKIKNIKNKNVFMVVYYQGFKLRQFNKSVTMLELDKLEIQYLYAFLIT